MGLGHVIKKLEVGQEITVSTEEAEYHGTVDNHGYDERKEDPADPWYDPGGASARVNLDQDTVERLNLDATTLKVTCGQFEDFPKWKTPVATLYHDGKKKDEVGEVTDILVVEN